MDTTTLYIIANSIALFNNVLIIGFLIFRKDNILPNYVLAFIFLTIGGNFLSKILFLNGILEQIPSIFFVSQNLMNLFSIAIYYYIHLIITDKKKYHGVLLASSIICIVYFLGCTGYFYSLPTTERSTHLALLFSDQCPDYFLNYTYIFIICTVSYLVVLYREIRQYKRIIENNFSSLEGLQVTYLQSFLKLLILLNVSVIPFFFFLSPTTVDYLIFPILGSIFYIFIIRQSILHNALFTKQSFEELIQINDNLIPQLELTEEQSSNKNKEKEQLIASKIEQAFFEDKVFKNPTLKLSDLAEKIGEPPYVTSQLLNAHFNKTFFEIVNELRVKESLILLKSFDNKKDTMEGLGYNSGFNSRASFYRAFKKYTGKMPSEFVSTL